MSAAPDYAPASDCDKVHTGTCLLIRKFTPEGTKVILLHRKVPPSWGPPGGWLDKGEDPLEGAEREAREEVGDWLVWNEPLYVGFTNDTPDDYHLWHSLTLWFVCDWLLGEPINLEPHKHSEVEWKSLSDPLLRLFKPLDLYVHGGLVR